MSVFFNIISKLSFMTLIAQVATLVIGVRCEKLLAVKVACCTDYVVWRLFSVGFCACV